MAVEVCFAAASEVAKNATELSCAFVGRHISYMFKYQSHLDKLKNQVVDLENAWDRVQNEVAEAKRQVEEIEKDVEQWLNDVEQWLNDVKQWLNRVNEFTKEVAKPITDDEDKVRKRCSIGLCPNMIQRYKLGKEAAKPLPRGNDLWKKREFSRVSHRPPIRRTKSVYIRGYEAFDSRKLVFQEIIEALKDANVNRIGVYGKAGVGKTTLVNKVAWQATEEYKLFDKVVITTVIQTRDPKKIQEEIADQLGLKFSESSVSGRSLRLRDKLKTEKKILVILEDIWDKFDLDEVGIPSGDVHKGIDQEIEDRKDRKDDDRRYKILLTSTDQRVLCNRMNTQKDFFVDLLSDEEAWGLFRKIVGNSTERSDIEPIAVEVAKKCGRLPKDIKTIAEDLKSKSHLLPVWEDALCQLTESNPKQIEGTAKSVCSIVELSYNFLKSEEKSLFLLCCLWYLLSSLCTSFCKLLFQAWRR